MEGYYQKSRLTNTQTGYHCLTNGQTMLKYSACNTKGVAVYQTGGLLGEVLLFKRRSVDQSVANQEIETTSKRNVALSVSRITESANWRILTTNKRNAGEC